ncbi:MAG: acyl-CoA synthetase [Minwuia sp.]|uniref:acyl-CoA synthetase n=1 Tax=Minwuia sp. TaxID=2493630 RepID=UPI003A83F287
MQIRPVRTPADVAEIEKTPFEELLPADNIYAAIKASAERHPDKPAVWNLKRGERTDEPEKVTYGELFRRITQTANMLRGLGIGEDDTVTLLMPVIPETEYLLWGAETAGIVNPVNPFLEPEHIVSICKAAGTKLIVGCHPDISADPWPKIEAVRAAMPDLKVMQVGGPAERDDGVLVYEREIEGVEADRLTFERDFDMHGTAALFHTGGTTGVPKLARHTQKGLMLQCWNYGNALGQEDLHAPMGLPMFHVGGATAWSAMPFVWGHTITMVGPEGYRNPNAIRDFFANAERLKWTICPVVPAIWSMLLQQDSSAYDLSALKFGAAGGSTLSVEVANLAIKKLGIPLVEGWGMTETHGFATTNPFGGETKVGSIGFSLPHVDVRVVHVDDNGHITGDCATDEIGLVVCRGPQIFGGYLDPVHDGKAWLDSEWFDTGDLGRIDADGYIWLTGRSKDLIIRGGHNIDPATIEDILYQHPAVELAAAVGRPDRRVGELPVAFIQFAKGQSASEDDLKGFVAERITERAANPVEIIPIAEMPLTGVGKIFKPDLRIAAAQRVHERDLAALAAETGAAISVKVRSDKVHGTLAVVTVSGGPGDIQDRIREVMGGYETKFDITSG